MNASVLASAKAYAALIGAICTALLGVFTADSTIGVVLTAIAAVATAIATWVIPNADVEARVSIDGPDEPEPDAGPDIENG